jgi:hypothetical protein
MTLLGPRMMPNPELNRDPVQHGASRLQCRRRTIQTLGIAGILLPCSSILRI